MSDQFDDLDRRLRSLAHAARQEAAVGPEGTEQALAEVTSGAQLARLRPAANPRPGRRWQPWVAVAAATALIVSGGIWLLTRGDDQVRSVDPTVPAPAVTTIPSSLPSAVVTVPPTAPSETVSTSPPDAPTTSVAASLWGGVAFEPTVIPFVCGDGSGCTQALASTDGAVVVWHPTTNQLGRYPLDGAAPAVAAAPEGTSWLYAAGPDEIAYVNVSVEEGVEGSADVAAVSLAAADAGTEVARELDGGNTGTDTDLVSTPAGIVVIGWYEQGWRPPADATLVMPWYDRDGELDSVPDIRVDAYADLVAVNSQEWQLTGDAAEIQPVGMPIIVATSEGGFLARYDEFAGDNPGSVIVSGRPDGTVQQWRVPADVEPYTAVPEPSGSVLVPSPSDGTWIRLFPFGNPSNETEPPPETAVPTTVPQVDLNALLSGLAWEFSGIDRACAATGPCTHVVFDPSGAPVSYDPTTRTLRRHMRLDDPVPDFVVPAELGDVWLLAAGPGEIVYLGAPSDDPEASDIVALTFAAGDSGREAARFVGALGLGDSDVIHTPDGLASVGWYGQGLQPSEPVNILADWVDASGAPVTSPAPLVQVDFYGHAVQIEDRAWQVGDLPFDTLPAWSPIAPTLDGGFIAQYSSLDGPQSIVVRGWSDGTLEQWEVPDRLSVILEPTGLVLVPNGEWFARVQPFEHSTAWGGRVESEFDTYTATAPGLDEYLVGNDPFWESDPIAFATALGGFDVASFNSIEVIESDADSVIVVDTAERLLDDSVFGARRVFTLLQTEAGLRLGEIALTQTCQPDRGHQNYQAALCV